MLLLSALTALFMGLGCIFGGANGALVALVIAPGMNLLTYWNADKFVLSMRGAREVDQTSAHEFYTMVAQFARRANLPRPRVYIVDSPNPAAAQLYIVPTGISDLLSTHPATEKRIAALLAMSRPEPRSALDPPLRR